MIAEISFLQRVLLALGKIWVIILSSSGTFSITSVTFYFLRTLLSALLNHTFQFLIQFVQILLVSCSILQKTFNLVSNQMINLWFSNIIYTIFISELVCKKHYKLQSF